MDEEHRSDGAALADSSGDGPNRELVTLAYWVPLYVTVDTSRGEVVRARALTGGMRPGPRINGQPASAPDGAAAGIVARACAARTLPGIECA